MTQVRNIILSIVCAINVQRMHANIADTLKVARYAVISTGLHYGAQVVSNSVEAGTAFDTTSYWNKINITYLQNAALCGALLSLPFTTYGRVARARWSMWCLNERLLALVDQEYENDAQLITALEDAHITSKYGLVVAYDNLVSQYNYLLSASDLIEAALEDIAEDTARYDELEEWLDAINPLIGDIAYAMKAIKNDARWSAILQAKIAEDTKNAMEAMRYQAHVHCVVR